MKDIPEILLDTNTILRLLLGDIPHQYELAKDKVFLIEKGKAKGIVSILVINELLWILEHYYDKPRSEFIPQIIHFLAIRHIHILEITKQKTGTILNIMQTLPLDFTDIYLLQESKIGDQEIFSFDKQLLNARSKN